MKSKLCQVDLCTQPGPSLTLQQINTLSLLNLDQNILRDLNTTFKLFFLVTQIQLFVLLANIVHGRKDTALFHKHLRKFHLQRLMSYLGSILSNDFAIKNIKFFLKEKLFCHCHKTVISVYWSCFFASIKTLIRPFCQSQIKFLSTQEKDSNCSKLIELA